VLTRLVTALQWEAWQVFRLLFVLLLPLLLLLLLILLLLLWKRAAGCTAAGNWCGALIAGATQVSVVVSARE